MELTTSWQRVAEATYNNVNGTNVHANTRFYLKRSSTDTTNNRHTIYWEFRAIATPDKDWATYWYGYSKNYSIYDGSTARASGTFKEGTSSSDAVNRYERVLASGSWTQNHNADGKWSTTLTFNGSVYGTAYTRYVDISLPTIPRQADIKTAQDFNDEQNPTITYENKAGNSVSSLQACISLTGSADDIKYRDVSKTGSSYTFELTDDERKVLRKATTSNSRNVYFYLRTIISGVTYYSSIQKEFKIINANPTFNDFEFEDIDEKTVSLTNNNKNIILGYSDVKIKISNSNKAVANKESSMVKYRFNSIDATYSDSEDIEITSNNINTGDFIVYAIDSRGNTTSKTKNAEQVISYSPLNKGNISVLRDNGVSEDVVLSFDGTIDLLTFGKKLKNIEVGDDLSGKNIYCQFPDNLGDELLYDEYGRVDDIQFVYSYNSELGALTGYMLSGLMYRSVSGLDYQYVSVNDEYIYNNDPTLENKTNLTSYKLPDDFGIVTGIDEASSAYKYIFIEESGVTNSIKKAQYRYKIAGSDSWSDYVDVDLEIDSNGNFSFNNQIKGDTETYGFDINNAYSFEVYIEDELSSITYSATLGSGIPHIAYAKNGVGIMGKYDESVGGLLQVGGKKVGGSDAYPVGSIYLSVNSTNPSTLFGGTWEQIKDRFLLASGSTYSAGSTGGKATVALSTAQLPSHTHSISSSGAHTHKFTGYLHTYGIQNDTYKAVSHIRYTGDGSNVPPSMDSSGAHTHTVNSTGSGSAHENMPPYLAVYVWKRIA